MTPQSQVQVLESDAKHGPGVLQALPVRDAVARRLEVGAQPSPDDLGGCVSAFCFLRGALEAMVQEVALLRRRDEVHRRTIAQFHEQMRSAAAIQRDLLPTRLPEVAGLDVRAMFRPAEALSGDLYDVFRIDDSHVAFFIADATGHGLPGGVLSTFVCRALRERRGRAGLHHALRPDEILSGLNRPLLDAGFTDCPFVAALYAVYHEPTRTLTWARGGAPYPILVRRGESPRQIASQGPLVGVVEEPKFDVFTIVLDPGDTVVFHTDGLEALLSDRVTPSRCCDSSAAEWFQRFGEQPLDRRLRELEDRVASMDGTGWRVDDVTVVALHVHDDRRSRHFHTRARPH